MQIRDWWWEFAARQEESKQLTDMSSRPTKFSGPEWDEARRRHREKMNGKSSKSSG